MGKKIILIIFCAFLIIMPVQAQDDGDSDSSDTDGLYASGKVIEILSQKDNKLLEDSFHTQQAVQVAKVLILNGKYRGETVEIENQLTGSPVYDIKVSAGDRVILTVATNILKTDKIGSETPTASKVASEQ